MGYAGCEIEYEEETLVMYEDPFLAHNTREGDHYCAHAQSDDGTVYKVMWAITNHESNDGSEACDWDTYRVEMA